MQRQRKAVTDSLSIQMQEYRRKEKYSFSVGQNISSKTDLSFNNMDLVQISQPKPETERQSYFYSTEAHQDFQELTLAKKFISTLIAR